MNMLQMRKLSLPHRAFPSICSKTNMEKFTATAKKPLAACPVGG